MGLVSDAVMGQRDRNIREDRWWGTFNALISNSGVVDESTKYIDDAYRACEMASVAHGFTPDSYMGPAENPKRVE